MNKPFHIKKSDLITKLITQLVEEKNSIELGNKYRCDVLMLELFIHLTRAFHHKRTYSSEKFFEAQREEFERLRLEIYESPDQMNASALAKKAGYSLARFCDLYKKYFTCTPIEDLTEAKKLRVKGLLSEGAKTAEIVKTVGFSGEEYFYRWFKKNFGVTVGEYRLALPKK